MKKFFVLSVFIAMLAAFFASSKPDVLEKVAEKLGFIEKGIGGRALLANYAFPFVAHAGGATFLAGVMGICLVGVLFWGIGKIWATRI